MLFVAIILLSVHIYKVSPDPVVGAEIGCKEGDPLPGNFLTLRTGLYSENIEDESV